MLWRAKTDMQQDTINFKTVARQLKLVETGKNPSALSKNL